jgi:hypothetical protein
MRKYNEVNESNWVYFTCVILLYVVSLLPNNMY